MTPGHLHPGPAAVPDIVVATAAAALAVAAAYLLAAARLRRRGDAWPWLRDVSFAAGGGALAWPALGPVPGGPFTAHMGVHLLTGMVAPLLLVLARPLTLALRSLPPGSVRRALPAVARSRPASVLVLPPVAALVDLGGLWLLYRTPLFAAAQSQPFLHALVHAHVLAGGLLFTFAVCRLDPVRPRGGGLGVRAGTLLAAGALHAVLAKGLYATAPPGTAFTTADLQAGARLMYYGGDLVELSLALVLAVQWYGATGRARARRAGTGGRPLVGRTLLRQRRGRPEPDEAPRPEAR
ncbi:cytochrome c oxidase assembly protein [Streptomyces sp. NPDC055254]